MKRLTFLASLLGLPLLGQKRRSENAALEWHFGPDLTDRKQVDPYKIVCGQNLGERPFCAELDEQDRIIPETVEFQKPSSGTYTLGWQSGKALNNQCPVCGTMVAAWRPKADAGVVCQWEVNDAGGTSYEMKPCSPPTERRIDCERCNATFRQFAEDR